MQDGLRLVAHPILAALARHATINRRGGNACPRDGWAVVSTNGVIHIHPTRRGEPAEWRYVLAHCLLHLGLGHFGPARQEAEWVNACDCVVARFLADTKIGRKPSEIGDELPQSGFAEEELWRQFRREGTPSGYLHWGTAGPGHLDMLVADVERNWRGEAVNWTRLFGDGLIAAVRQAVRGAAGEPGSVPDSRAEEARIWFINRFPLLGALAAGFKIITDQRVCHELEISVAAVDAESRQLYFNPAANLDDQEMHFVMALSSCMWVCAMGQGGKDVTPISGTWLATM